jgi:hypothetical protein
MTRAHHCKRSHKKRACKPRTRRPVSTAAPNAQSSHGPNPSPRGHAVNAQPSASTAAFAGSGISDALALCGLVLSTFGPEVVLELLKRIAVYGADLILASCQSARRAAEVTHQAHVHVERAARARRRRRTSRTNSRP